MIRLMKYLKKKDVIFVIIVTILVVLQVYLELKMPDYSMQLTSILALNNVEMKDVLYNGGMMLLCAFAIMILAIICSYLAARISSNFGKNLRENLFKKIEGFSSEEINGFSTASLITRSTNDVVQMQNFISMGLQLIIRAPVMAIMGLIKISSTSIYWTNATLIAICIILAVVIIIICTCLPKFKKIQKLTDNLNNAVRENITGVRVIRAFNAEDYQEDKFEKVNSEITKTQLFTNRIMGVLSPTMTIVMQGLVLVIYIIAGYLINNIELSKDLSLEEFELGMIKRSQLLGQMTAFTTYAMKIVMSFMMLVMIFIILPRIIVSSKRINEVLDTKTKIIDGLSIEEDSHQGKIIFDNVNFSYPNASSYALRDICLEINPGETIAFIGATGSGKTTLVNLLNRFYDVSIGQILIDDINVKDYKIKDLNDKISLASQKAVMFKGTIKDNIAYGVEDEKIDVERINEALKVACAEEFVSKLDNGIDSKVAQGGTNFSGGQKQRLSIARAIYKRSEILIFDDTFSALDYKTDQLVRRNIKQFAKNSTIIIVAQRIGTIKNADKIVVLDDGQIVGIGTHEELIENCQLYKEIALSQLSKEEL